MAKFGGFPGGMGGMNMNNLMKEAKKMQEEMEKSQAEISVKEFEATAGGGVVTVKVNGKKEVISVVIKKEAVDPEDVETLQDLILICTNEALRKVDAENNSQFGKYNIPGLF